MGSFVRVKRIMKKKGFLVVGIVLGVMIIVIQRESLRRTFFEIKTFLVEVTEL